jgi:hypothetical protein
MVAFADKLGQVMEGINAPGRVRATSAAPTQTMPLTGRPFTGDGFSNIANRLSGQSDELMDDWLGWMYPQMKSALADNRNLTNNFQGATNTQANTLDWMGERTSGQAEDLYHRNRSVYMPLADKIVADANQFDRAGYGAQQAGLAIGDMSAAFAARREADRQRMAQYGIDPTSGRAMAMDRATGIQQAAQQASAATRARMAGEELWGKKQMDALGTSSVINANEMASGNMRNLATGMYNTSAGVRKLGLDSHNQYLGNMSDMAKTNAGIYEVANRGYNDAAGVGLQRYGIDKNFEAAKYGADKQAKASRSSAIGGVFGSILGAVIGG